jgi:N-acetylglutamate synthase-like GNAT family acetyltransferase
MQSRRDEPQPGASQRRIEVRQARRNDASKLAAFFIQAWNEAGPNALGFAGATDEAINAIATEAFLSKRLTSPVTQIVVAETERRFVGFASLRKTEAREAELSGIVVLESETGTGIGSRLLKKSVDLARRRGIRTLVVKTETANLRALSFYKKAGFTESNKLMGKVGGTKVLLQLLQKRL